MLHTASVPVLLVRSGAGASATTPLVRRIVVPLDGRPLAEEAIPLAVSLANALKIPIALIRVVRVPLLDDPSLGFDASTHSDTRSAILRTAENYLARITDDPRLRTVTVTTQAVEGVPAIEIVGTVEAQPGSVVVMATHSRPGVADLLLGSVARRVVHDSYAPVVLVRPRAFSQAL